MKKNENEWKWMKDEGKMDKVGWKWVRWWTKIERKKRVEMRNKEKEKKKEKEKRKICRYKYIWH